MTKLLPDTKESLFEAYLKCGSVKNMSLEYKLPKWFILFELFYFDIIKDYPITISNIDSCYTVDELREGMRRCRSVVSMAKEFGVDYSTVRKSLLITGMFPKAWGRTDPKQWSKAQLMKDWDESKSIIEISKKYNCHRRTILNAMNKLGIEVPSKKKRGRNQKYYFTKPQLQKDYDELKSITNIATKYNCSIYTIWKYIKQLKVNINDK